MSKYIAKSVILGGVMVAVVAVLAACAPVQDGKYAKLAQCITEKGAKVYGAFWCPHCQEQKDIFGADQRYLPYVECDPRGHDPKIEECAEKEIDRYPTWVFPGQGKGYSLHTPAQLAKKVGCEETISTEELAAYNESQQATETSPVGTMQKTSQESTASSTEVQ